VISKFQADKKVADDEAAYPTYQDRHDIRANIQICWNSKQPFLEYRKKAQNQRSKNERAPMCKKLTKF